MSQEQTPETPESLTGKSPVEAMSLEELRQMALADEPVATAEPVLVTPKIKAPEKLLNKKYYRTVNIDLTKEQSLEREVLKKAKAKTKALEEAAVEVKAALQKTSEAQKANKAGDDESSSEAVVEAEIKTTEDYKVMLRGMGFKV